ncbi:MAG: DUF2807 domain-containing protein [Tannerellaceae bacterium]|nr:DUF2807 domain-containing protein [Tannerellaceae bacterium]
MSFKVKKGKLLIEPEKQSWNTNVHPTCFIVTTSSRELVSLTVDGGVTFTTHTPLQSEYLNIKIRGVGNINIEEEAVVKDIKVSISGSGNIRMPQIATNSFHASIPGSGDLRLGGTAEEATFKIYGSGSVYAYDLVTRSCESSILGSGGVQVTATERVKGKITGSGDVLYKGQPAEVERKVLGSGNVRSVD